MLSRSLVARLENRKDFKADRCLLNQILPAKKYKDKTFHRAMKVVLYDLCTHLDDEKTSSEDWDTSVMFHVCMSDSDNNEVLPETNFMDLFY